MVPSAAIPCHVRAHYGRKFLSQEIRVSKRFVLQLSAMFTGSLLLCCLLSGQAQNTAPVRPAPRGSHGHVLLGASEGSKGVWQGDGRLANNPNSYEPRASQNVPLRITEIPMQAWTRAIVDARHAAFLKFEPHARCKASGGPREFVTPYGVEFVEMPELQRIYVFDIGGPHSFRTIFMDGRKHPKDVAPSFYGDSIGRW